jgi:hypothetical protein
VRALDDQPIGEPQAMQLGGPAVDLFGSIS